MSEGSSELTAFHEAGHAVVGIKLGLTPTTVTIVPNEQTLGLTSFGDEDLHGDDGVFGPYADHEVEDAFGAMSWAGLLSQERAGYPDPEELGFGRLPKPDTDEGNEPDLDGKAEATRRVAREGSDLDDLLLMCALCTGGGGDADRRMKVW